MKQTSRSLIIAIVIATVTMNLDAGVLSVQSEKHPARLKTGILLLAHGGSKQWNNEVNKIASLVNGNVPVEVAFGMATKRNIQGAIDRLIARGIGEIVAVPLFVSSHSSVITSTEYLLGLRKEAPKELAVYARMNHGHGEHQAHQADDPTFDPTAPVKSSVRIRMTNALNRHSIVSDILLSRLRSVSAEPGREVGVIVAHGPVSDEENDKWLADMAALVGPIVKARTFKRIEYLTVRDDAPAPIRAQAAAQLRSVVERATSEGNQVLIVPLLLSYGGIEEGIKQRLQGLNYIMCRQALLPDERLARWVLLSAGVAQEN